MPSFNLAYEPFIPCIRVDGHAVEYSVRDVLGIAHEIAELRDSSPLATIALHRLLLAILHRVYRGPKTPAERMTIRNGGTFDVEKIESYLKKWADRLDLLSDKYPFYQRASFKTAEPSGINRLAQELSRGNNAALFDHTIDDPPPAMSLAQAARIVIAEQAFAVGGGKSDTGNTTHAPLVSGAIVLLRGNTLFETLWLNLTVYAGKNPVASLETDSPVWERATETPHTMPAKPRGYLDYLTWQTRTLCLQPETEGDTTVVRRVCYSQGRKFEPDGLFFNPMCAYSRKDEKEPWIPVRFNEWRDLWRDSSALYQVRDPDIRTERAPRLLHDLAATGLRENLPASTRYQLSVFGICTDKAKVNFWRHEEFPLPLAYLEDIDAADQAGTLVAFLKQAIALAEDVSKKLRSAAWATASNLLTGNSGMSPDKERVSSLLESFAPERLYWSRLERPYRELLVALAAAEDRPALIREWFVDILRPAAIEAFDNTIGRIDSGRDLKAVTAGRGVLYCLLNRLEPKDTTLHSETQEVPHEQPVVG